MPIEMKDIRLLKRLLGAEGAKVGLSASDHTLEDFQRLATAEELRDIDSFEREDLIAAIIESLTKKELLPLDKLIKMPYDELLAHFKIVSPSNSELINLMAELGYNVSAEDKKHLRRSVARQLSETALFSDVALKSRNTPEN